VLTRLEGGLDALAAQSEEQGVTQQFQVERQITEVTGMRLASLLLTSTIWAEQTARNTERIATILSGTPNIGLRPPPVPEFGPLAGSGTIGPVNVYVQPPAGMPMGEAQALGQAIGEATVQRINERLGKIAQQRALLQGTVIRN